MESNKQAGSMEEGKDRTGRIIALLRQAELLLRGGAAGRPLPRPEELAGIVHELERRRLELQSQDEELAGSRNELPEARDELERRVAERTSELQSANLRLQQEIELCRVAQQELRSREEQLQASVEKFRAVVDCICDWEYWLSPKGEYLYISLACEEVSGYGAGEFAADPGLFFSIIHPDDRVKAVRHFAEESFDRPLERFDFRIVTKGGEVRWVSHACRPVHNAQGEFIGRRGAIRDISYRKGIEERLIRSEERLLLALDASSDGVWDRNLVTGEVYHGENWHRVLGYSDEEAKGMFLSWENLMHPDDRQKALARVEEHLKGITCRYEAEFRMRNKAGEWQWILSRGRVVDWDEAGRPVRFVGTHTDITFRKNFELELRNTHDELEQRVASRTKELEETNIALTVLLKKIREDKRELGHHIAANVRTLVEPYLSKLKKGRLTAEQKVLVNILEANLDEIVSPFTSTLSSKFAKLTPAEIQVANLIKQGMKTKDIAELLNLSPGTIDIHRKNIRKKLGLTNQGGNLQSVLTSFT